MHFSDFIEKVHGIAGTGDVSFAAQLEVINTYHAGIGEIEVYPVQWEPPSEDAIFQRLEQDRTSAYDDEFWNIRIYYCASLDRGHPRQRRFALTKELLHIFDSEDAWARDRTAFEALLRDIQNNPLPGDRSEVYNADMATRWPALVTLCQLEKRNEVAALYQKGEIEDYEIAGMFGIPTWTIPYVVDDYFLRARETLMSG